MRPFLGSSVGFIWSLRCLSFFAFRGVLGVGVGFNRTGEIWRFALFFFNGRDSLLFRAGERARARVVVCLCV